VPVELPAVWPVSHSRPVVEGRTLPIDQLFDVSFADEIARLESYNKHHYRPNTYLHKWWARRCGSTFRLILKHLVADPKQRDYYAPGGLEGKVILDPMMGGGTTLHEALRLGANVVGIDIDPIPVVQARATLSDVTLPLLEAAFAELRRGLGEALAPLFQTSCPYCDETGPLRFTLYGAHRHCACGPALLVDTTVLRRERDGRTIRLCPRCHRVVRGQEACDCPPVMEKAPLVVKELDSCPTCGEAYQEEIDTPYYARYRPLVVVGQCSRHGLFFVEPGPADRAQLALADSRRPALSLGPRSAFAVAAGPKSRDLLSRGVTNYLDLFSSRQLLYLEQAMALLPQFAPLVRLNLGLLISTSLEFNSLMCGYKGARGAGAGDRPGAIRHTFSYHAYTFPYTALENNPLFPQKASGTLEKLFHDRIRRARHWALQPRERNLNGEKARFRAVKGEQDVGVEVDSPAELAQGTRRFFLQQRSATRLPLAEGSVDYVVTDPPYYDSVQYSDLATFFRLWLQRLVPEAARWHYDLSQSAVDSLANSNGQYTTILSQIFGECRRVLRPEGRLIFTFHNWKPRGWTALTLALQRAGFRLVNHYVVHSENPVSVHIANMRALTHDAILVLAPEMAGNGSQWQRPPAIDKSDSARFCADCASLLGWLLEARLDQEAVARVWERALVAGSQ